MRPETTINSGYRWIVLSIYAVLAGVTQMLGLNFAPLLSLLQSEFSISELLSSMTIMVFPLIYVLISIPTGILIDRWGYKRAVGLGAGLTLVFACLRICNISFGMLLVSQAGIALGQPLIVNGVTKLVSDWFNTEEIATATGLCAVGIFIGMAVGMATSPPLVLAFGFRGAMIVFAAITTVSSLCWFSFVKQNGPIDRSKSVGTVKDFKNLLSNRKLLFVFVASFLAIGLVNGLLTWLELILAPHGINSAQAGFVGAILMVGGICGSIIIPALSDKFHRRQPFLFICCIPTLLLLNPLCNTSSLTSALVLGGIIGFAFMPGFPLLFAISEEQAGAFRAGVAAGILMLSGNLGAVVVIISMDYVKGQSDTWQPAVHFMLALLAILTILIFALGDKNSSFKLSPQS